jgi:hypothetical protein
VGFVADKAALGQVFSEYFGFPCQSFHQFLHHNHPGMAQYAIGGRSAEFQGLLHPAQANLGYFHAWVQSLQLPSTQSESHLPPIPLSPKSNVSFEVCTQL